MRDYRRVEPVCDPLETAFHQERDAHPDSIDFHLPGDPERQHALIGRESGALRLDCYL